MSYFRRVGLTIFSLWVLSGIIVVGLVQEAESREREFRERQFIDSRYHHDRSYPARGQYINRLPPGHREVFWGRTKYYFFDGAWYRPTRGRFLIVAPPIGLVVPFLPPYYATVMIGGVPYYYANEVYYTATPGGYVIVAPPEGDVLPIPPPQNPPPQGPPPGGQVPGDQMTGEQMFIYPRQGQNEKKQADDRYECHRWAASQTGYDPTKPPTGMPEAQIIQKRADYQRAMGACLDGRGYTVR